MIPVPKVDLFEAVGVADGEAAAVGHQAVIAHCATILIDSAVGRKSK